MYSNTSTANNTNVYPASIIKPSSLNYKISLKLAVQEFIKKESKIDNFTVMVMEEDTIDNNEMDDALFEVKVTVKKCVEKENSGTNWD